MLEFVAFTTTARFPGMYASSGETRRVWVPPDIGVGVIATRVDVL
jgi:hypothetical protein